MENKLKINFSAQIALHFQIHTKAAIREENIL